MSRIFGEIRQIAFVVPNINESMQYWSETLGIGPWFIKRAIELADFRYYGHAAPSPRISIALANSGGLQVELIEQHDDKPSIYRDFLISGRSGLQHVSAWVTCSEFDSLRATLIDEGLSLAQEGTIAASGTRLAYYATADMADGIIYEVSDLMDIKHIARVRLIEEAAHRWDGTDPVRETKT
jgi:glyoxalase/bleomycin resistance protein/dioxygenase superfamily protein